MSFREQAAYYDKLSRKIIPPDKVVKDCPEEYSEITAKMLEVHPEIVKTLVIPVVIWKVSLRQRLWTDQQQSWCLSQDSRIGLQRLHQQDLHQLSFLADDSADLKRKISRDRIPIQGSRPAAQSQLHS